MPREVAFHVLAGNIVRDKWPICETKVGKAHGYIWDVGSGQVSADGLSAATQTNLRERAVDWRL